MNQPLVPERWQRGLPRAILPLLLLVLLASLGLRVYRLGDKSVWWDEGLAAWAARQSPVEIAQWTSADVHPPLYFWMLYAWRRFSGESEFGLRYLSAMIGVLTVAATYRLANEGFVRGVSSPAAGLLAAALIALSRFDVWWSQEMRMYALSALWAALALWAAIRTWDRGRPVDALLYILFVVAGLYTLYLSVSVLVVANLVWLWGWWRGTSLAGARNRWQALLRWSALQVTALTLFAPWLLYALRRMPTWSSASPVSPGVFLRMYWTVLTLGISTDVERYAWLTLPLLALFLAGLVALFGQARRQGNIGRNAALLLLGLLLPAAVVYAVSLPRETFFYSPQLAPRYLIVFAPAFYVLLAWGLFALGRRRLWPRRGAQLLHGPRLLQAALSLLVLAAAAYGLWSYYPERVLVDDYKSLAATLRAHQRPEDAVVLYPDRDWPVFSYHYAGTWHKIPHALRMTPEAAEAWLAPVWDAHEALWLVTTPDAGINDPQGEVPAWLDERATSVVEYRLASNVLRLYARTPDVYAASGAEGALKVAPGFRPPHAVEGEPWGSVRLVGYEQPVPEYRHGDTVHLALYWEGQGAGPQPTPGSLEVDLVDASPEACTGRASGTHVWIDLPTGVDRGTLLRRHADVPLAPDLLPGRYQFRLRPVGGEMPDPTTGWEPLCVGGFTLRPWPGGTLSAAEVTIGHPLQIDLGEGVRLLGYDLDVEAPAPGEALALTLYWQARRPVESRYKVFTHLLGEVYNAHTGSFLWGQQDNEPVNGARPTSTWRTGEVIVDRYAIPVDAQAPPGSYAVEVGLYHPATLERLPVLDDRGQPAADHILLTRIEIERSKTTPEEE